MPQKILLIQDGSEATLFPLLSLTIGLHKANPGVKIIWVGLPQLADLIRYNKRINRFLSVAKEFTVDTLQTVFGADVCINPSYTQRARNFASNCAAQKILGFDRNGPTTKSAEFFHKVASGKIRTYKTSLQLYYNLAELRWSGEGFGLSYYPRTKQTEPCGIYLRHSSKEFEDCVKVNMPKTCVRKIDTINRYNGIITDDLFVAYSAIALRKHCRLFALLPYQIEFFNHGKLENPEGLKT